MQLQVYLRLSCPSGLETEQLVNFIKRKDHKMVFKLSQKSLDKLNGVHPDLVETVERAIELTDTDFGVIYGVRDLETQKRLFSSGKSQTMASKHLIQNDGYSHAVDLMAYDGSNPSWDIVDYDNIADAMKKASKE